MVKVRLEIETAEEPSLHMVGVLRSLLAGGRIVGGRGWCNLNDHRGFAPEQIINVLGVQEYFRQMPQNEDRYVAPALFLDVEYKMPLAEIEARISCSPVVEDWQVIRQR